MAYTISPRTAPLGAITTFRAVSLFEQWIETLQANISNRRTQRELAKLSDHVLDDIGLHRGMIEDIDFKRV